MTIRRVCAFMLLVVACGRVLPAVAQQPILDKALFDASWQGNADEVARLLKAGANPKAVTNESTPLHKAASRGELEIMKLLIDSGADVTAKALHDWTPLVEAAGSRHPDATKLL